jgi:hypothetical protein
MRIQILPLPSVMVGDDMEEPFALVFDQAEDGIHKELLGEFARQCGAKTFVIVPQTVEIVDRYAEADPVAVREFNRLDDYLLMNFAGEPGVEGDSDSAVDVAIRLLNELLRMRESTIAESARDA